MITKAFVEEVISPYEVKVRIPILDRVSSSSLSTNKDNLNIATICSLPNCYINVQVGDVVFVGFEDNTYYKVVILGHLSREGALDSYSDITLNSINVKAKSVLSSDTSIGDVSSDNISHLVGTKDNIQKQLTALEERIEFLEQLLTSKST